MKEESRKNDYYDYGGIDASAALQKQKKRSLLGLILCAVAVAAATAVLGLILRGNREPRVENAGEAIELLESKAEVLGYENALSELTELHSATIGGDNYYRLQQNYQGIPVYGRSVVYATDEKGNQLSVTQNIQDIPDGLELIPTVTLEQARKSILEYLTAEYPDGEWTECAAFTLDAASLYIYDLEMPVRLVYEVNVGGLRMLIDAHSAQVLGTQMSIVPDIAVFQDSGAQIKVPLAKNGRYALKDEDTGVYMYTVQGKTYWDIGNGPVNPNRPVILDSEDAIFGNEDDNVSHDEVVRAEAILNTVNDIGIFFEGIAGKQLVERMFVVFDDDMGGAAPNAGGGYGFAPNWIETESLPEFRIGGSLKAGCIILGKFYSQNIEEHSSVYAHEYTHAVTQKHINWSAKSDKATDEGGAISEAFSDVFGELYEGYHLGVDPDWVHNDQDSKYTRSQINPSINGHPVKVGDPLPLGTSYRHEASTIISHTAYLMWNGIDGDPAMKISTEELAQLWYRAILMLPSDADFEKWSEIMWLAAHSAGISDAQMQCVRQALDQTGIKNDAIHTNADFCVGRAFTLNIYDADNQLATDCNVIIKAMTDTLSTQLPVNPPFVWNSRDSESCRLELETGIYMLSVVLNEDPKTAVNYAIEVKDGGADELNLYMNQGKSMVDISVRGILSGSKVPLPGATVEVYRDNPNRLIYVGELNENGDDMRLYLKPDKYTIIVTAPGYEHQQFTLSMWDTTVRYSHSFLLETTDEALSDALPSAPAEITGEAPIEIVSWEHSFSEEFNGAEWTTVYRYDYPVLSGDDPAYNMINADLLSRYKPEEIKYEKLCEPVQFQDGPAEGLAYIYPSPMVLHNGNGVISILITPEMAVTYSLYNGARLGLHILSGDYEDLYLHKIQQVVLDSGFWDANEKDIYALDLNDFAFVVMNGEILILGTGSSGATTFTPFERMLHTGLYVNTESTDKLLGTMRLSRGAGSAAYEIQKLDRSFWRVGAPGCIQSMGYWCEYPVFSGTPGCGQINQVVFDLAEQFMTGIPDEITRTSNRFEYSVSSDAWVEYNNNGIASYVMGWFVILQHYENGQHPVGAQMYDGYHCVVFDLETGEQLTLQQVTGMDEQTLLRMLMDAYGRVYNDVYLAKNNLEYDPSEFELTNPAYILDENGQILLHFTAEEVYSKETLKNYPRLEHKYGVRFPTGLYVLGS